MPPCSRTCSLAGVIPLRRTLTLTVPCLLLTACTSADGPDYSETDRQSETLATAISYPRQADAAGFGRAVLATTLGKTPDFSLLEATDLDHVGPEDPMARLVWRIHQDGRDGPNPEPAFDACYLVEFNYYGPTRGPELIDCPADATPITPPATPRHDIPAEANPALQATLVALPPTPTEADVRAAVAAGLPAPPVDEKTGLAGVPPDIFVTVQGTDVGVALFAKTGVESKECVLGHRVGNIVRVWGLSERDLGPREAPCTAEAALTAPA
jgi:hypothetical protein